MRLRTLLRSLLVIATMVTMATLATTTTACNSEDSPVAPSATANVPFQIIDLAVGTGPAAANGDSLTVSYTGWLWDPNGVDNKGQVFDSASAAAPFAFVLGTGQVIAGWDQGVVGMLVGGVRRLIIPPALAYGEAGSGPIPPNATIIFEIGLIAIQ